MDHDKSTNFIATNVVEAVITALGTSNPFRDDILNCTYRNTQITKMWAPTWNVSYAVDILYGEMPHEVGSFFRRQTHHIPIFIGIWSNTLQTAASILDMDPGPKFINTLFSPQLWDNYIEPDASPNLKRSTKQAINIDSIIQVFVRIGDVYVRLWFGVVRNLSVDVLLGTSFIFRCI